jgi:hypothetical protein
MTVCGCSWLFVCLSWLAPPLTHRRRRRPAGRGLSPSPSQGAGQGSSQPSRQGSFARTKTLTPMRERCPNLWAPARPVFCRRCPLGDREPVSRRRIVSGWTPIPRLCARRPLGLCGRTRFLSGVSRPNRPHHLTGHVQPQTCSLHCAPGHWRSPRPGKAHPPLQRMLSSGLNGSSLVGRTRSATLGAGFPCRASVRTRRATPGEDSPSATCGHVGRGTDPHSAPALSPKRSSLLLWPSILASTPTRRIVQNSDPRSGRRRRLVPVGRRDCHREASTRPLSGGCAWRLRLRQCDQGVDSEDARSR